MRGVFVLYVKFPTKTVGTYTAKIDDYYKTYILQLITYYFCA